MKSGYMLGLGLTALLSSTVHADTIDFGEGIKPLEPSRLLENADGRYDHWTGIGHIESLNNRRCTAVLIDTRENNDVDASEVPAYVISSGHCAFVHTGMLGVDLEIEGQVEFNYFKDTASARKVYPLKRLNWSSMQGTDLALLQLQAPLSDLIENGIQPLRLNLSAPQAMVGKEVITVTAPLTPTGYTLRLAACTVDAIANIVEQPFAVGSTLRNQCADVLPGSSGGPVLDRYTNEVLGIMSTTTRGATQSTRCFSDSPCEVNSKEPTWLADTNYAAPVDRLNQCFAEGVFTPQQPGCQMLPASVVTVPNPYYQKHYVKLKRDKAGEVIAANWDFKFAINTPHYAFKTTREPQRCQAPHRYSEPVSQDNAHIQAKIGTKPGIYTLCIVGLGEGQRMTPAARNNAYIHTVELVEEVPAFEPRTNVQLLPTGRYSVAFTQALPGNAGHLYKFGKPEATHCDSQDGYKNVYGNFTIGPRLLPVKLCSVAKNAAGELSAPREDLLAAPDNG